MKSFVFFRQNIWRNSKDRGQWVPLSGAGTVKHFIVLSAYERLADSHQKFSIFLFLAIGTILKVDYLCVDSVLTVLLLQTDPIEYVEDICENMQLFPKEDFLTGDQLMFEFKPEVAVLHRHYWF